MSTDNSISTDYALAPCRCGALAEFCRVDEDGDNFGGEYVKCTSCGIATDLRFPCMEDVKGLLAETWNRGAAWMPFNLNHKVRVKLTNAGREALRQRDAELNHFIVSCGGRPLGQTYREDADGWSEWQLWSLMQALGYACVMGRPVPFDTTIELWMGPQ